MKTLILGMGNPILRDDAVGLHVIEDLRKRITDPLVSLQKTSLAGLNLLDLFVGFERVILVDAIQTGGSPGHIYRLTPKDFVERQAMPSFHNIDLFQALGIGSEYLPCIPGEIVIVAIETKPVSDFGEGISAEAEKAIPAAVERVLAELNHATPLTDH